MKLRKWWKMSTQNFVLYSYNIGDLPLILRSGKVQQMEIMVIKLFCFLLSGPKFLNKATEQSHSYIPS